MRNKKTISIHLLIAILAAFTHCTSGQNTYQQQIQWEGRIFDVITTNDSGKIFTGGYGLFAAGSNPHGNGAALIKLDKLGNPSWQKLYGPGPHLSIQGYKVLQTTDEGYLMVGLFVDQTNWAGAAPYFVKTDKNGTRQWAKKIVNKGLYDPSNPNYVYDDYFLDVQETKDGGYICVGKTSLFGTKGEEPPGSFILNRPTDVWLIKIDASGTIKWTKTYGNRDLWEVGYGVRQTTDGGYIIAGTAQTNNGALKSINDNQDGVLLKTDDQGVLQWQKRYGSVLDRSKESVTANTGFNSLELTKDSGFIVSCTYADNIPNTIGNSNSNKASLVKIDKNGDVTWNQVYSFSAFLQEKGIVYQTADKGYALGMQVNGRPVLLKSDTLGEVLWAKVYGKFFDLLGAPPAQFRNMLIDKDEGYLLLGDIYNNIIGQKEGFMLTKTDTNGSVGTCQNDIVVSSRNIPMPIYTWSVTTGAGGVFETTTGSEASFSIDDTVGCFGSGVTANFNALGRCLADSVFFENWSTGTVFHWNFGDPVSGAADSSVLVSPKHKYTIAGTYSVTLTATDTTTGSSDTTTGLAIVFDAPDKTIPYSGTYCTNAPNVIFDTTGQGYFTFSPASGLSMINENSGELNLQQSSPGNYILIYHSYACPAEDTINIIIAKGPTSKFSYDAVAYCKMDVNPLPVMDSAAISGIFSSAPAGLVIKDVHTGEIDLASSAMGNYTVTNSVNDVLNFPDCPSSTYTAYISVASCTACSISVSTSQTNISCDSISDGTATVTAIGNPDSYLYSWNTNPVQTIQTAIGLSEGSYTVTVTDTSFSTSASTELVINGDFTAGNTGFYSSYTYAADATAKGQYNVYLDPTNWNQSLQLIDQFTLIGHEHTATNPPYGNFMMVAGDPTPNASVWCDTIIVTPNTTYIFSAWLATLYPLSPAELMITVNGVNISTEYTAPQVTGVWEEISAAWNSGINTTAVFCIANQNTSAAPGNWFGLDDISIREFTGSDSSCMETKIINITRNITPIATSSASATYLMQGDKTQLNATGDGTYQWLPTTALSCITCPNPIATPLETIDYCVKVTNTNSCTDSACITITVETLPCGEVFVPSAFSPNNDGNNDVLYVKERCIQNMDFKVYDRWGEKVFEAVNPTKGWDGTYNDNPMNSGIFVYYLEATLTNGEVVSRKGNIVLMR